MKSKLAVAITVLVLVAVAMTMLVSCTNDDVCKIVFYADGSVVAEPTVKKGQALDIIPEVPVKDGMVGVWSVTDFDEINGDMVVYAIYSEQTFTVTFMVDGNIFDTRSVKKDSVLTAVPAVPEKSGYSGEWSVGDFGNVDRNLTVTAIYTPIDALVIFSVEGETYATRSVGVGGTLTDIPAVPEKSGRNLSGRWLYNGTTADFSSVKGDMTVTADYFVTITLEGGAAADKLELDMEKSDIAEIKAEPDAGTVEGKRFIGWYKDPDFREECVFPCSYSNNDTIYARRLTVIGDTDGFTFADGAVTGYTGTDTEIIVPFRYRDGDAEVLVTKVGDGAFEDSQITKITLPSTVKIIGESAFASSALQTIEFADGSYVERIESQAFTWCTALTEFPFFKYTEYVGDYAFCQCTSIRYVGLADSAITEIGDFAFDNNYAVENFTLPATLEIIGDYAFRGANATFDFSSAPIAEVGAWAFKDCRRLTTFTVPTLTEIGASAFVGCSGLSAVTIPATHSLCSLFYSIGADDYDIVDGYYPIENAEPDRIYYIPDTLHYLTVTPGVGDDAGVIQPNAYIDFRSVKRVTLCSGVTKISRGAFEANPYYLTDTSMQIVFSDTLTEIEPYAFKGRNDIRELRLPASLETIGAYAFNGLDSIRTVTIEANNRLNYVGEYAFNGTYWYEYSGGLVKLGRVALGISDFYVSASGKINITASDFDGVNIIAPGAFANNSRIKEITLGPSIVTVGNYAFGGSSALEKIHFNATLANIGVGILRGSHAVKEITLGASKSVGELFGNNEIAGAFPFTPNLITYYISPKLETLNIIADSETVIRAGVHDGLDIIKTVNIGEGITSICDGAFINTVGITTVNLPGTLVYLGENTAINTAIETEEEPEPIVFVGVFASGLENVNIPADGQLKIIYDKAFYNTSVQAFTVPGSVLEIGKSAFEKSALKSLTFAEGQGDTELVIKEGAFREARFENFTLVLPEHAVGVGKEAFKSCHGLVGVKLNEGLQDLGESAFADCGITVLNLPRKIKMYGELAEDAQPSIYGDGVDYAECLVKGAFKNNPVQELTLNKPVRLSELFDGTPDTIVYLTVNGDFIIDEEFLNCASIQSVTLNDTSVIGEKAFKGCASIKIITLPGSVASIADGAFRDCTAMTGFIFTGTTAVNLGESVFAGDIELREVLFPTGVQTVTYAEEPEAEDPSDDEPIEDESAEADSQGIRFVDVFNGCTNLSRVILPAGVTEIGKDAFRDCVSLRSVTIPENVNKIGDHAFYNCGNLIFDIVRFEELTEIGEYAFAGCVQMRGLNAKSVETIGEHAFDDCTQMKEITVIDKRVCDYIGDASKIETVAVSVKAGTVADGIFKDCTALKDVIVYSDEITDVFVQKVYAELTDKTVKVFLTQTAYEGLSDAVKSSNTVGKILYVSPREIGIIYSYDDESMTATVIGCDTAGQTVEMFYLPAYKYKNGNEYRVVAIGKGAFRNNTALKEIIIPYTVGTIGEEAFRGSAVKTVKFELGSRLESIGKNAFYNCTSLTAISLPDGVTRIESGAFYNCNSLESLTFSDRGKLTYIGEYAFLYTKKLASVTFYGTELVIDKHAFENSGLSELNFGDGFESLYIAEYAFAECYALSSVILPDCAEVNNNAFEAI